MSAPSTSSLLVINFTSYIRKIWLLYLYLLLLWSREKCTDENYRNDGDGGGGGCGRSGDGHGSYNLEKVLNFSTRHEKSLNSVKVFEKCT